MTNFETSQGFINIGAYRLNVTARLDQINRQYMTAIVEKTVKLWLFVAKAISENKRKAEWPEGVALTPEDIIKPNYFAPIDEPRCTVWGDCAASVGFTVHSYSNAQDALDVYWSRHDALTLFALTNPPPASETPKTPQNGANANVGANPANPTPLQDGVISATRAPNPKSVEYADGQLVAFGVNKVAMGANKGSATYALWGSLGQKYPLTTIYKNKPNSDENSPNYIAIKDFIVGLGLSVDAGKVEAAGNWTLICKAVHVPQSDGTKKEYLNVMSMTAVQIGQVA
jgi:hypothetical protein